jgi:hypothetical protein
MPPRTDDDLTTTDGVTGGKDSIRERVLAVANDSLSLLDDLQSPDNRNANEFDRLRILVRSHLTQLVGEMSVLGGPRVPHVEQLFASLLEHLASLQDRLQDDDGITSFPALADNVASLYRSWNNMQQLFNLQITIVNNQLNLVIEALEELRSSMNNAAFGTAERQIMIVGFDAPGFEAGVREQPHMSVENLLTWISNFASEGGPRIIEEGGGFALRSRVAPAATQLSELISAATDEANPQRIPARLITPQIARTLASLAGRLDEVAWNC